MNGASEVLKSLVRETDDMRKRVESLVVYGGAKDYEVGGVTSALNNLKDELARAIAELERR